MKKATSALLLYTFIISQSFAEISEIAFLNNQKSYHSSEYIFQTFPNQELISVKVLGAVKNAGLYHVPPQINLPTLIALAGGTTSVADTESIIISNEDQSESKSVAKKINLIDSIQMNAQNRISENDIVYIKDKSSLISGDTMKSISIVSLLLSAVLTSVIIKEKTEKK